MHKSSILLGAVLGGLAVILGAFGAHTLKEYLEPSQLITFETAVRYQMYHALVLLFCGLAGSVLEDKKLKLAIRFFGIGILLFSGSLYLLVALNSVGVVGLKGIGIITPIGGLFFILGWIFLILAALKSKTQ